MASVQGNRSFSPQYLWMGLVLLSFLSACKPEGFINKVKYNGEKYVNTCETFSTEINKLIAVNNDSPKLRVSEYDNSDFSYFYLEPGQFELVGDTLMFRLMSDLKYPQLLDKGVAVHVKVSYQDDPKIADLQAGQGGELGTLVVDRAYYAANRKPIFLYKVPLAGNVVEGKQLMMSFSVAQYDKKGNLKKFFCETDETPVGTLQPVCCTAEKWQPTHLQSTIDMPALDVNPEDFVYSGFTGTIDVQFQESSASLEDDSTFSVDMIQSNIKDFEGMTYNVSYMDITGYASPGGTVTYNQDLSEKRANSVREGVKALNGTLEGIQINSVGKGEDWDRVRLLTLVSSLNQAQQQEVISIVEDDALTDDEKEAKMRKVAFWDTLVEEVLVKARHTFTFMDFEYKGNEQTLERYTEREPLASQDLRDIASTVIEARPYAEAGNPEAGYETIDRVLSKKASPNLYAIRATYHLADNDYAQAIEDLEKAGRFRGQQAPLYELAVQGYKVLFSDSYTFEERKQLYTDMTKLTKDNPGDRTVFFNRAVLMDKIGYTDGALKEYSDLLNGYEPTAAQLNNRGVARMKTNRITEAMSDFEAATTKDANLAEAWFNMAAVSAYQGYTRKTMEYLDKAVKLNDQYKELIFNNPVFSVISEDPRFDKYRQ